MNSPKINHPPRCLTCRWAKKATLGDRVLSYHLCAAIDRKDPLPLFGEEGGSQEGIWVAPDFGCVMWEAR